MMEQRIIKNKGFTGPAFVLCLVVLSCALLPLSVSARTATANESPVGTQSALGENQMPAMRLSEILILKEGESRDIGGHGVETAIVSNPSVVKLVVAQETHLIVVAKSPGDSDVIKVMKSGELIVFPVRVEKVLKEMLVKDMNETLMRLYPASDMRVRQENETLILSGNVASDYDLDGALAYLKGFSEKIVNLTRNEDARQVRLEVKIVELNRTRLKNFGINFLDFGNDATLGVIAPSSLNSFEFNNGIFSALETTTPIGSAFQLLLGSGDFGAIISILEQDNMAKVLSQPSLIAEDGEEAKFFVGGTIPIPVPQQDGLVTIEWKDFGIRLEFKPRIVPREKMKLKVKAESSELNRANGVTIQGTSVPAIDTRKVETDVTIAGGEQFVIGGLYFSKHLKDLRQVPYLGNVPVLGAFFKRVEESNEERELIAVIRPEFVNPVKGNIERVEELIQPLSGVKWSDVILGR